MPEFSRKDISTMKRHLIQGVTTEDRSVRADVFARLAALYRAQPGPEPNRRALHA